MASFTSKSPEAGNAIMLTEEDVELVSSCKMLTLEYPSGKIQKEIGVLQVNSEVKVKCGSLEVTMKVIMEIWESV